MTPATHEREILEAVDLCRPDGSLNRASIGWSRHPLQRCNLGKVWGRRKRWDYWGVMSAQCLLSLTYADFDYLGLVTAAFCDLKSGEWLEWAVPVPGALGLHQPDTVGGADIRFAACGLQLALLERPGGTEIEAHFRDVSAQVWVERPPSHETLNVVIPWSSHRFQFTSKQNTLPARGSIEVRGQRYELGPEEQAFACLDFGRGVWPYRSEWNWASASGHQSAGVVGLRLGGRWTDHTGMTENALCVDGQLLKIGDDVDFEYDRRDFARPWRIRSRRSDIVELRFEPFDVHGLTVPLGIAGARLRLCLGHFSGSIAGIEIQGLRGWAEEMRARW